MKKILLILAVVASPTPQADTYVDGYTRSNGTYVMPHYRSDSNSNQYDNYSSQGNSNPYTGSTGYQANEYTTQQPQSYNYGSGVNTNGTGTCITNCK